MLKELFDRWMEVQKPNFHEQDGVSFSDKRLFEVETKQSIHPVTLRTLDSLVGFVQNLQEVQEYDRPMFIHVCSHDHIEVLSILDDRNRRDTLAVCEFSPENPFRFDAYHQSEDFIVKLQTCFVQDDTVKALLKIAGNVKEENIKQTNDDGVSQTVTARSGVVRVEDVTLPNPVKLSPFRTFPEVKQPESLFVLRAKEGPQWALFNAGGGHWKLDAVNLIASYLKAELTIPVFA